MFYIQGDLGDAMAADLNKFILFDPNFGEFSWTSKAALSEWLDVMFPLVTKQAEVPKCSFMMSEKSYFREIQRYDFEAW